MPHGTKPTVLLIEADISLRRLIALGLQYRGMHVIEAHLPSRLAISEYVPDLLVLDVDSSTESDWLLLSEIESLPDFSSVPIIALAWETPVPAGIAGDKVDAEDGENTYERVTYLTKPFDARALYVTVEQLLEAQTATATTRAQNGSSMGRAVSASVSIWPLLTAAGLLLAFIGLMGALSLIIIGLLIVAVSLLWWTLGSKPEHAASPMRVERPYPAPVS